MRSNLVLTSPLMGRERGRGRAMRERDEAMREKDAKKKVELVVSELL